MRSRTKTLLAITATAAFGVVMLRASRADAAPCTSLGSIPIVFIENGDTQEPLVKLLGQALVKSATPVRIVYKNRRTCDLALDMYTPNKMVNDAIAIRYIPTPAENPAWDPSQPPPTCEADATSGNTIDLGIGATFLSSCTNLPAKPADLSVTAGPVQSYGFIVPKASSQVAMTAEEGYFAYGWADGTGSAQPWTDQALRFSRGPTASTALTCAAAIGLKASQLKGTVPPNNTSTEVLTAVKNSATPEATIGLMGTEVYDQHRGDVKLLAFQGFKQLYAYYPDKTAASFDKQNVRDGHYLPWAPTPYITRVDGSGKAVNPNVQRIIDLVLGDRVDPDVNGLEQVIASGLVPECAMGVQREFDGGNLSLYSPPESCACYFESKVPQSQKTCKVCTTDGECSGGKCRRNVCEAK
ncbi:hypothetical protein AKJ09_08234 [Labilithrix luteola]|uniref:PBP domain-containing protein n=1 Tax=Labilithrix luteola TaxID=1391654 RepID=A0A0K1Q6W1_9BACT|nr:hypothetical protein [Labilithrix luteola]AKV01571.1 hypothetical protein AKJ09_08234 [Labilithrix luteola]